MLKRNGWTRSRIALREWLPVIVLMCCTFVFNTSEFIPIGLLSDIAVDFGITEARAGLLITVYAWVVALVSLPLMLAVARMECRRLMLGVLGLFIASHVLSGLSSSYAMLRGSVWLVRMRCSGRSFRRWRSASHRRGRNRPHWD